MKSIISTLILTLLLVNNTTLSQTTEHTNLSKSEVSRLVEHIIELINSNYVDISAGRKVVEALNRKVSSGEYDHIKSEKEFVRTVTQDMRSISNDLHLSVLPTQAPRSGPVRKVISKKNNAKGEQEAASFFTQLERPEGGFFKGAILEGGVGLLTFTSLLPPLDIPLVKEDLDHALETVRDASQIIFDARKTRGGVPETVAYISSNLYGKSKVLLNTYINRLTGNHELYTDPDQAIFSGKNKTVYILISGGTGSGAEAFAYMNQQHGSVIVVGEVSAGAGRLSAVYPISATLSVMIPENESIHPVSKEGFEKVGVQPDVFVHEQNAQNKAHLIALEEMLRDHPRRRKLKKAIKHVTALVAKVEVSIKKRIELSNSSPLAGNYEGKRSIWLEESGELKYQRGNSLVLNLKEVEINVYQLLMGSKAPKGMVARELPRVRFVENDRRQITAIVLELGDGRHDGPYKKVAK